MKPVVWMGSTREDLIAFPADARRDAGYQLYEVQRGGEPDDWKPMSTIGSGVREIRINEESGAFRVVYLATRPEGVYVLHCCQKKSQKTSRRDLRLAIQRFKAIPRPGDTR
jgi:phage-related protein